MSGGNSVSKDIEIGKSRPVVWLTSLVWFEFNVFEQGLGWELDWRGP